MAKNRKKKRRSGSEKSASPQLRERTYQSGLSYFREGKYEQAIRAWSSIVDGSEPKLAAQLSEAYFRSAVSKYGSGDMKAAISELHSALKYNSSHSIYLFHIGLAYHRMGKLPQAITYYTRAIQAEPEVERYKYHLGLVHLQNGEVQESIKLFEAIKGIHGRIGKVLAYMSQRDYESALKAIDRTGDSSELKFLKGLVYLARENYGEAKILLKTVSGNGISDFYLGIAHARTDAMLSAIKAWEDASQKGLDIELIKDDMADIYRQLAVRYFDRGNLNKVMKIWEKLLEVKPEDDETRRNLVHAYFLRGNDYAKAEQFNHAIRYWKRAWELDSTNVEIAHNLALAYEKRNETGEAAKYWKAAATGWKLQMSAARTDKGVLQARMHTVHTHLADIALEADNIGRAIVEYNQALRYAPDEVKTIVKLADLYMMQRSSDKAIQLLSRARRLSPADTDVLQQMSFAYVMQGKFDRSMECMKEILKIDPGNQLYRGMVGQYYLGRAEDALDAGKPGAALRFINEGLEVDNSNIELRAFVGAVYLDMEDKSRAEAAFQETIAINTMDPKAYIAVAHHYIGNEMLDDAEVYFAKAIALDPNNARIYMDIADEYCRSDICERAREYFEKAKAVTPGDASVLVDIVDKLLSRKCSKYGLQYAKELMSMASNDPKSYFLLGLAYHLSDMNDEAMNALIKGMDMAKKVGDNDAFGEIGRLINHIEFENKFGSSWKDMVGRIIETEEFDFEEEEW